MGHYAKLEDAARKAPKSFLPIRFTGHITARIRYGPGRKCARLSSYRQTEDELIDLADMGYSIVILLVEITDCWRLLGT